MGLLDGWTKKRCAHCREVLGDAVTARGRKFCSKRCADADLAELKRKAAKLKDLPSCCGKK